MQITKRALDEIHNNKNSLLKISLDIGGCRGFRFTFEYISSNDILCSDIIVIENSIVIDIANEDILKDFELDFIQEFGYQDFILNPLSKYDQCGCGESFNKL